MKSWAYSAWIVYGPSVDAIGLEQLSVLPHIQYNNTDEPITFFDLIIEARSQMRGQRAMQGGLGVSPGGLRLCVGKFRGVPGGPKLLHAQAGRTSTVEPRWERLMRVLPYPTWPVR